MYSFIKDRWNLIIKELDQSLDFRFARPSTYRFFEIIKPTIEKHARGRLLDLGCGSGKYKQIMDSFIDSYVGMDIDSSRGNPDIIGEAHSQPFESNEFDTIFCAQVLNHLKEPQIALKEMYRVLKSPGCLILSAPHIMYLNNEPYDFYRYTRYGLDHLLQSAGFEVLSIEPAGGLVSFFGNLPPMFLLTACYKVPLLWRSAFNLNKFWCKLVVALDNKVEKRKIFALNYVAVARKK